MLVNRRASQLRFTLTELMVWFTVTTAVLLWLAPFAIEWKKSSLTREARADLMLAYGLAKSAATRNMKTSLDSHPTASLKITSDGSTTTLLVCAGPGSESGCKLAGSKMVWMGNYPSSVVTKINDMVLTKTQPIALEVADCSTSSDGCSFELSYDSAGSAQTGNLK